MSERILVINPNSTVAVTEDIDRALEPLRFAEGPEVVCLTLAEVGANLRDETGAEVLVLGCAGMARYRKRLEDTLGVPVIDPTQAAVAMAIAAVRSG